jgi:cytidylate kinase
MMDVILVETIKIAIDGPAGAGKTTIAKAIASRMGFLYVDTGALYRAVALKIQDIEYDISTQESVDELMRDTEVDIRHDERGNQHIFIDGRDVTEKIRTQDISMLASEISKNPAIRNGLIKLQRDVAYKYNIVMDGRDIASVILPNASLKFFITATLEERALRRYNELKINQVYDADLDIVKREIKRRDKNDSTRENAPLMLVSDAIVVDTTDLTLSQAIDTVETIIKEKLIDVL